MKQKKRTQPRFRSQIRTYSVHERHTTSSLTQGGILRNDMRLLLNQFCQTYAAPNIDCSKLVPPNAQ
jgi:hypothetical protein